MSEHTPGAYGWVKIGPYFYDSKDASNYVFGKVPIWIPKLRERVDLIGPGIYLTLKNEDNKIMYGYVVRIYRSGAPRRAEVAEDTHVDLCNPLWRHGSKYNAKCCWNALIIKPHACYYSFFDFTDIKPYDDY